MSDLFFISPAGYRADYNQKQPAAPFVVEAVAPGQILTVQSTGEFALDQAMNAKQGQIHVRALTGVPGTPRALAFLVDNVSAPTRFFGFGLDSGNRPMVFMQDRDGTLIGEFTSLSTDEVGEGYFLDLVLAWQSTAALSGTRFALVTQYGQLDFGWATDPTASWTPFVPTGLLVGTINGTVSPGSFESLEYFNGTIQRVRVITLPGTHTSETSDTLTSRFQVVSDALVLSDALVVSDSMLEILSDTLAVSDTVLTTASLLQALSESMAVSDGVTTALT